MKSYTGVIMWFGDDGETPFYEDYFIMANNRNEVENIMRKEVAKLNGEAKEYAQRHNEEEVRYYFDKLI